MSGPWERYQQQESGPWSKYAEQAGEPEQPAEGSRARAQKQSEGLLGRAVANIIPGAIRGAASIGATLLAPNDMLNDRLTGQSGGNTARRQGVDDALQSLGADPTNPGYRGGKVLAEVAGTMGAGPAVGGLLKAAPIAARVPGLVQSIETGGMVAGARAPGAAGLARNVATRAAGGAVAGGASAGLVDPETAGFGAAVGGVLPPALMAAGAAGRGAGRVLAGPAQTPELAAAVQQARGAGYVIPPTQARPSLVNRAIEGFSGKITTAQNASARNQGVTNAMAAKAVGLPPDVKITPDVLEGVRKTAGQAYDAIGQTGTVTPAASYGAALDAIAAPFKKAAQGFPNAKPSPVLDLVESLRSPSFDAASAVAQIKQLRTGADDAFRKGDTDIGRASRKAADAIEDALDQHLQALGNTQALQAFRDARQLIAKTYTVQKALNPASGSVDARKLGAEIKKGKPLTGDLRTAGEFGLQFPKAAQAVEGMGSLPQTSPLDWAALGSMSAVTGNPLLLLGTLARPAARGAALSGPVQNRLVQGAPIQQNALMRLLTDPRAAQLGYLGAPVAVTSGGR